MAVMTEPPPSPPDAAQDRQMPVLPRIAHESMSLLYQHRLVSGPQLLRMLRPDSPPQYLNRNLLRLHRLGLADRVRAGWGRPNFWFLTETGARAVEGTKDVIDRPYRMTAFKASGPLQRHTEAVVETGLAFVETARARGDRCGPFDWVPEVSHPLRDVGERLVADALLHYISIDPRSGRRSHVQFFVEVDRATMPIPRLAAKLAAYARYHDYVPGSAAPAHRNSAARSLTPAWRQIYPRFPRVLLVLTGDAPERLTQRLDDLAFYVRGLPYLHRAREGFAIGATTLDQLRSHGPVHPVWRPLLHPTAALTDFLLTPGSE